MAPQYPSTTFIFVLLSTLSAVGLVACSSSNAGTGSNDSGTSTPTISATTTVVTTRTIITTTLATTENQTDSGADTTIRDTDTVQPADAVADTEFDSGVDSAHPADAGAIDTGVVDTGTDTASSLGSDAGPNGTPVAVHGRLHIQGNKFVDGNGNVVVLHGMSMYDWSQQGQQFYNATAVGNLANEMKCTALRVPLNPSNYPAAVPRIKTVIDACIANGIYCILDWHPGSASNVTNATAYFVEMAQAYHDVPNVMYEPWNEPNGANSDWTHVKAYHEQVMSAVRPIDPNNIFILGTPQWDQLPQDAAADPITDQTNVAYTVHFYANSHPLASFQPGIDKALNAGLAIFVTEYGGVSANGNGTFNVAETQKWWNYLAANDIGDTNWAVETNTETSSVFVTNASATGPWPANQLTNSGNIVFPYIASNYAATVAP